MIDWQYKAIEDVVGERLNQDAQWGGYTHDDTHEPMDWHRYIEYQLNRWRITQQSSEEFALPQQLVDVARERLVKIAALALAAIESIDRKGSQ
jgi:hypothetical protein